MAGKEDPVPCVVCKLQPCQPDIVVRFISPNDTSISTYLPRLGAVLGMELTVDQLAGTCLCKRCEARLVNIEQLQNMQKAFKDQFLHTPDEQEENESVSVKNYQEMKHSFAPELDTSKSEDPCHSTKSNTDKPANTDTMNPKQSETHCQICNTSFSTRRGLHLHQHIHRNAHTVICKICRELLSSSEALDEHIKLHHTEDKLFRCSLCDYTDSIENKLKQHGRAKHRGKVIKVINQGTKTPEKTDNIAKTQAHSLSTRLRSRKASIKKLTYKCAKCKLAFSALGLLKKHLVACQRTSKPKTQPTQELESAKGEEDINAKEVSLEDESEVKITGRHEEGTRIKPDTGYEEENSEDIADEPSGDDENHDKNVLKRRKKKQLKMHQCPECPRTFTNSVQLTDHTKDHLEGRVMPCHVCGLGFLTQISLDEHILKHTGRYPFMCSDCGRGYSKAWMLKNHVATVHSKDTPYTCKYCSVGFNNINQRRRHYARQHTEHIKQNKSKCQHCDRMFSTVSRLDLHIRKQHPDKDQSWPCSLCTATFNQLVDYKEHCRSQHQDHKSFTCETCTKSFSRKANYRAHLETHNTTKTAECPLCCKKFKGKSQLDSHLHWHKVKAQSGNQSYLCEECGVSYKNIKTLRSHVRCHRGEGTLTCHICQLVVPTPSSLQKHMDTAHATVKPYHCQSCDKSFVHKISYDAHINMHTDARPFLCSTCGKGFRTRHHLKEHTNLHTQTKAFHCDACEKSFMWRAQLIRHKNSAHRDPNVAKPAVVRRGPRKKPTTEPVTQTEHIVQEATISAPSVNRADEITLPELAASSYTDPEYFPQAVRVVEIQSTQEDLTTEATTDNVHSMKISGANIVHIKQDLAQTQSANVGRAAHTVTLQSMLHQAVAAGEPATSGEKSTTYVLRPSNFGLLAHVLPAGDNQHNTTIISETVPHHPDNIPISMHPDNQSNDTIIEAMHTTHNVDNTTMTYIHSASNTDDTVIPTIPSENHPHDTVAQAKHSDNLADNTIILPMDSDYQTQLQTVTVTTLQHDS